MSAKIYRETLVALVQALKALLAHPDATATDVYTVARALEQFLAVTPPYDCYPTRNVCGDFVRRILYPKRDEMTRGVGYELCRDMLGMLDAPYDQR